jgi:hypothetical protein
MPIEMPSAPLPEMTLPAPASAPPIVFGDPRNDSMPLPVFGSAALPVASVPIQLPTTTFGVAKIPEKKTPVPLPEIRFRASVVQPPTRLPPDAVIHTPVDELGVAEAVPAAFVPM